MYLPAAKVLPAGEINIEVHGELGVDLVVHSTTKYLNGHSDVVGGAVVTRDPAVVEQLAWWANWSRAHGVAVRQLPDVTRPSDAPRPDALARGERAACGRPVGVHALCRASVLSRPGRSPWSRDRLAPAERFWRHGELELASAGAIRLFFVAELRLFSLAESLGGGESLIAHPATMTHASMTPEARAEAGISDTLLRLSVGIEHADDLVEDLRRG